MQRLATRADREHLGQNADRHLLRALGAQVELKRRVDAVGLRYAQLLEELLLARAWTEQAQVRWARLREPSSTSPHSPAK